MFALAMSELAYKGVTCLQMPQHRNKKAEVWLNVERFYMTT